MLEEMKKEIYQGIKKLNETGKMTAEEIKALIQEAVAKAANKSEEGISEMNEIAKEAATTAVEELRKVEQQTKENVDAAVEGVLEGAKQKTQEVIDTLDYEMLKAKYKLQETEEELALKLKDALDGVKEAASRFTDESKEHMEEAVTNVKLQHKKSKILQSQLSSLLLRQRKKKN